MALVWNLNYMHVQASYGAIYYIKMKGKFAQNFNKVNQCT